MYLLAPFILQNVKKILRADLELWECAIFGTKMAHLLLTKFFSTNHYYYFHLPIGPFPRAKFKILTVDPELWACVIFGPKMVHLLQTNFFWKIINIILIYLLVPFLMQNFRKIVPADPEWGCAIFWPKMVHLPKWEFFSEKLLMSLVSFIHVNLHAKNQSQILIYYWNIDD